MTIADLGSIGELIASIGVLLSLIYLAIQIRQNTANLQVNAYQELIARTTELNKMHASDPELLEILERAGNDDPLTAIEARRYFAMMMMVMRNADMAYYQYTRGLLPEDRLRSILFPLLVFLQAARARWLWDSQFQFDPEFKKYVYAMLEAGLSSATPWKTDADA